ncbi:hypothetical protein M3Y95_00979500 [Aphelenchoides besseyi]|nr:hypothetical protein M3Y95_00979500 [Aphelenchoides besseyi]
MPVVLSRGFAPALRRLDGHLLLFQIRLLSTPVATNVPKAALKQLTLDDSNGYFHYERDRSRDSKAPKPQKLGDTPARFLLRKLGHAYEIYPLFVIIGGWFAMFVVAVWYSFGKIEVWFDRSKKLAPWDWERIRDGKYATLPTVLFDLKGHTHQRLEIMEQLQDQMLEAAKKRGTR